MALVKADFAQGELEVFEADSDEGVIPDESLLQLTNIVAQEEQPQRLLSQDFSSSDERPRKRSKHSDMNEKWKKFTQMKDSKRAMYKKDLFLNKNKHQLNDEEGLISLEEVNRRLRANTVNIAHSPLHWELVELAHSCAPRSEEVMQIVLAISMIQQITELVFGPQAQAMLFGSQAVGLALPGSDLDVVILNVGVCLVNPAQGFDKNEKKIVNKHLWKLYNKLNDNRMLDPDSKHVVITQAKVPIIKTALLLPNGVKLPADISIGVTNGAEAVTTVMNFVRSVPEVRPLILCIKALLKEQGRNQAFTGGVSSYSVFNLVLVHLMCEGLVKELPQTNGEVQSMSQVQDLLNGISQGLFDIKDYVNDMGDLLLGFLRRYGIMMDFKRFGISIVKNKIIRKYPSWIQDHNNVVRLAIEDHQEVGKNIGSSSYKILQIQELFKVAYGTLKEEVESFRSGLPCSRFLSQLFHVEVCISRDDWGLQARQQMEEYNKQRDEKEKQQHKQERAGRKRQREDGFD